MTDPLATKIVRSLQRAEDDAGGAGAWRVKVEPVGPLKDDPWTKPSLIITPTGRARLKTSTATRKHKQRRKARSKQARKARRINRRR